MTLLTGVVTISHCNLCLLSTGELKPVWKSMPIPTKQEGPVQVLVADNFETVAFKSKIDRDIVFYVYAPWLVSIPSIVRCKK